MSEGSYYEVQIDEDEFDIPPKMSFKANVVYHRKKIIIALAVVLSLLIIGGVIALMVTTLVKCEKGYESVLLTPSKETLYFEYHLKNSTEMQINLINLQEWTDREGKMDEWIAAMNHKSKYLNTEYSVITDRVREQYDLDVSECKSRTMYRVREYTMWKDGAGDVTIDSKYNDKDIHVACTSSMAPAEKYKIKSSEKCEFDRHECPDDDKYSREGRIFFDEGTYTSPTTCADMIELYPDDFKSLSSKYFDNPVSKKSSTYWLERKYIGYMEDTKYEISFTLRYGNIEDATTGNQPHSGEWSIRTYTIGDGFTDTWNSDVAKDIEGLYSYMMDTFGEPGCDE